MAGEWIDTTIGEQATLQRGIDITKAEQVLGTVPVISSGGVSSYHDTAAASGPGVILGRKGVVGSVYFVPSDYWPHDTTLWVKDFHGNDRRFVYYFFRWMAPRIAGMDVGSANPTLNRNHLHPIEIRWPPLPEQHAIAHILGTLDDKIELNRRMNETLEAMARALFKSWFVDFDPVRAKAEGRDPGLPKPLADLFPDSLEQSELGQIPKGWEVKPFADMVEIIGGGTPKTSAPEYWKGEIPWFSVADAPKRADVWVVDTEKTITREGVENSSTRILPVGATIISARGTVGRIALVGVPMAMNQSCYGLQGKRDRRGFCTYFATSDLVASLQQHAHGSVFDTITRDTLAGVSVAVPSAELVEAFDTRVGPSMERIRAGLFESRTLAAVRDTLLPKLISGELPVKDAERFVTNAASFGASEPC
ncbi:MAG: restriction endonuclease subunit S [Acidobacteria bacterium]|nr:restriction endonuclease subunit S [Acidobacteriota bacterium]